MSEIERSVRELTVQPKGLSLLDGLLLGAVLGAIGGALVVLGRVIATRRIAQRLAPDTSFKSDAQASPL
jgi:hypothetical protein